MSPQIIEEYNEKLKQETKNAFAKAKEIFSKFILGLNITDTKKIIMCCGNHDGLRFIGHDNDSFTCGKIIESDFNDKFSYYTEFCKNYNSAMGYETQVYTISGINFLIANTNWKFSKEGSTNNACMNCKKIDEILNENEKIFNYANRNNNVFVAHKPFDDICENAKLDYSKDYEGNITVQNLKNTIGTILYGDKHSYSMEETTSCISFMAGAPLNGETISYNLIDFKVNKGVIFSQYVRWFKDNWVITPVKNNVEDIYNCSKKFIKPISYKLLLGEENGWDEADKTTKAVKEALESDRVKNVSEMFASCCRCREQMEKVNKGVRALQIDDENIFDWVSNILTKGCERDFYSLNVRGECGAGKTTFLGMLYLYLLYLYKEGSLQYIPMYFDMEKFVFSRRNIRDEKNYKKIHDHCYKGVEKFLGQCSEKERKFKKPICVIVDGLDYTNFLTSGINAIEKDICNLLNEKIGTGSKYVLCFNTHQSSRKMNTVDGVYSKHVLYFNTVDITENKGQSESFYRIVHSYATLLGFEREYKKMLVNILEYQKHFLDLDFLHSNFEDIRTLTVEESWDAMLVEKDRLAKQVTNLGLGNAKYRQVAFLLQQKNRTFHELQDEISDGITYEKFYLLKTKEDIRKYLFACYYVAELEKYSSNQCDNEQIDSESVLFYFIPRDISVMIRLVLHEKIDVLEKFLDRHQNEIKDYLFSTMVYLVSHAKDSQVRQSFEAICANVEVEKKQSLCGERSLKLAQIICSGTHEESVKYIYELMDDKQKRIYNRNYQLYYYGDKLDRTMLGKGKIENMDIVGNRFDFHNCFIVLSSKLAYSFKKKRTYKLMELDLFTLCDLLYSRLQHVKNSDEIHTSSFFYCREYNKEGNSKVQKVVKTVIELLDKYIDGIKLYNPTLNSDERLYRFFKLMMQMSI